MPRLEEAKKDVLDCEKSCGAVKKHWYMNIRMGQPSIVRAMLPIYTERTQGSETSQYLQEKKSTEIPKVVANEMGIALKSIGC